MFPKTLFSWAFVYDILFRESWAWINLEDFFMMLFDTTFQYSTRFRKFHKLLNFHHFHVNEKLIWESKHFSEAGPESVLVLNESQKKLSMEKSLKYLTSNPIKLMLFRVETSQNDMNVLFLVIKRNYKPTITACLWGIIEIVFSTLNI